MRRRRFSALFSEPFGAAFWHRFVQLRRVGCVGSELREEGVDVVRREDREAVRVRHLARESRVHRLFLRGVGTVHCTKSS